MPHRLAALTLALVVSLPLPAFAFDRIVDGGTFTNLVTGRTLTRIGIRLQVEPDGDITGNGMGWPVSGAWTWRDGFFCRSLNWGGDDLGDDCQTVLQNGDQLRFVAERGGGQYADFRLR
jgi:hypothetical protein